MDMFICPICNTAYKTEDGEIIDTKDEETGEDDKMLICKYCEKIMNILRRHECEENLEEALEDMCYDIEDFILSNIYLLGQKKVSKLVEEISREIDKEEKKKGGK